MTTNGQPNDFLYLVDTGYCKKEVKTQIGLSANIFGLAEEEHGEYLLCLLSGVELVVEGLGGSLVLNKLCPVPSVFSHHH